MKFLVTVTPGPMPPPIEAVRAAQEWIKARVDDGTFECVYAFPEGGGCSIGENDSHEQLMEQLIDYLLIARHLERIADHATNIAEDVIYLTEGEIVRHKYLDYEALFADK